MTTNTIGYLLDNDLLFGSRITGTAKALGLQLIPCRTAADLLARAKEQPAACVILDLHQAGPAIRDIATQLKAAGSTRIVAYGSHVAADDLKEARDAGCDVVLPRSQFVADLAGNLPIWFASES